MLHNLVGMGDTDMVQGLSFSEERADDVIQPQCLHFVDLEALSGF